MEPDSIDLIVTDPPYGIAYCSGRQGIDRAQSLEGVEAVVRDPYFTAIANDTGVPVAWLPEAFRVLRQGTALYVFSHWRTFGVLAAAVSQAGFIVQNMIVCNKSNHGMGNLTGAYAPKHELCLFAAKGKHRLVWEKRQPDVWDVPVRFTGARRLHPNEKPKSWFARPILNSSLPGAVVCDPFCGSGTAGVVALEHARKFVGIDLDANWTSMTERRLSEMDHAITS